MRFRLGWPPGAWQWQAPGRAWEPRPRSEIGRASPSHGPEASACAGGRRIEPPACWTAAYRTRGPLDSLPHSVRFVSCKGRDVDGTADLAKRATIVATMGWAAVSTFRRAWHVLREDVGQTPRLYRSISESGHVSSTGYGPLCGGLYPLESKLDGNYYARKRARFIKNCTLNKKIQTTAKHYLGFSEGIIGGV